MKPVHQNVFGKNRGNCMSACLASLLELNVDDVPCFMRDYKSKWYEEVQKWLGQRGLMLLRILMPVDAKGDARGFVSSEDYRFQALPECLCMITGKSPRGEFLHTVVGRIKNGYDYQLEHDPYPNGPGIIGFPVCIEFLIPLNPVMVVRPI